MTAPRQVVVGRVQMLTRRCTQRQYLLRPDALVEQIYLYCLAEAAARYEITLHGWIAMSNHEHVIVRDNLGNLPEFMAHRNKMAAKALNAHWNRSENLWSAEQPSVVHLADLETRFEKLIYLLANPVADHLVERLADWPGACSFQLHLSGRSKTVERPRGFFRTDGPMPKELTLRAEKLEGFDHLSDREWADKIGAAVQKKEEQARKQRATNNRRVFGRKAVLRVQPTDAPTTARPRRTTRPHLACRNPERREYELRVVRDFRSAHRNALLMWIAGWRSVPFPAGTYRMRAFGVRCHRPSADLAGRSVARAGRTDLRLPVAARARSPDPYHRDGRERVSDPPDQRAAWE